MMVKILIFLVFCGVTRKMHIVYAHLSLHVT